MTMQMPSRRKDDDGNWVIEMHTTVLTEGKAVRKNKGLPVVIPPQF